jgi:hypothetical protein
MGDGADQAVGHRGPEPGFFQILQNINLPLLATMSALFRAREIQL